MANYREYKENQGRRHLERAQQKVQLSSQRLRLQNALKHELERSLGEQVRGVARTWWFGRRAR